MVTVPVKFWIILCLTKQNADKAVLEEAVAGGQSKEEALAQYLTDENFESWYEEFCNSLNAAANS